MNNIPPLELKENFTKKDFIQFYNDCFYQMSVYGASCIKINKVTKCLLLEQQQ